MNLKESFLLKVILPCAEKLQGTCAVKWYRQIEEMQSWSREEITAWQNQHLQALVHHVYDHTVFYHRLFDELNIRPEDIRTISDLGKLPVIDKQIANEHFDEIVPDNLISFKYRKGKTGGTTGEPMFYFCDENVWGYVTANKIFNWRRYGYRYGDRFAVLGSSSLFSTKPSLKRRIYDWIRREYGLNSVNMTDDKCAAYVKTLKRKHIHYINGYAASLYVFAQYVSREGIDLSQIKVVFSTSENLTDEYRAFIEKTFDCKVVDCYGARDAGISAYETAMHNYQIGYNVMAEISDLIAPNTGTVLSTNLLNYTFPLLRYRYGDVAELETSPQRYNGQQFNRILGRTSDVLRLDNGNALSATGFSMIMKNFDIEAFEFYKMDGANVVLKVKTKDNYDEVQEARIINTLQGYLGQGCTLHLEKVDHFDVLPNGKRRYYFI